MSRHCQCNCEINTGSTAVFLPEDILNAIINVAKIIPSVIVPGQGLPGPSEGLYAVFPIVGKYVKITNNSVSNGIITHNGGLIFSGKSNGQNADLEITNFKIKLETGLISANTVLTIGCNKQRLGEVNVFQLDGVSINRDCNNVTGTATNVKLTAEASSALNQIAAQPIFTAGLSIGSASFAFNLETRNSC